MTDHQVSPSKCPKCGAMLDSAMSVSDDFKPVPETAVTICFECLAFLMWNAKMELIPAPADVVDQVSNQREMKDALRAIVRMKGERANAPE